jgi:hypothetical protein
VKISTQPFFFEAILCIPDGRCASVNSCDLESLARREPEVVTGTAANFQDTYLTALFITGGMLEEKTHCHVERIAANAFSFFSKFFPNRVKCTDAVAHAKSSKQNTWPAATGRKRVLLIRNTLSFGANPVPGRLKTMSFSDSLCPEGLSPAATHESRKSLRPRNSSGEKMKGDGAMHFAACRMEFTRHFSSDGSDEKR